jgi:hypothetical protein
VALRPACLRVSGSIIMMREAMMPQFSDDESCMRLC